MEGTVWGKGSGYRLHYSVALKEPFHLHFSIVMLQYGEVQLQRPIWGEDKSWSYKMYDFLKNASSTNRAMKVN